VGLTDIEHDVAGELDETMRHVRRCKDVKDLPKEYRDAEEWALIYVAHALQCVAFSYP